MADSSTGEKTERPTSKKLRDAKNKGDVAKSKDVSSTAVYVGLFLLFISSGSMIISGMSDVFKQVLLEVKYSALGQNYNKGIDDVYIKKTLLIVVPAIVTAAFCGVLSGYMQVGFIFATESLKMDINKLNPITSFIGKFKKQQLINHALTIGKTTIILGVVFIVVWPMLFELQYAIYLDFQAVLTMLKIMLIQLFGVVAFVYAIFASFDWFVQNALYIDKLKMSKYDVKKEYISSEGDPMIKGKRKQFHRELTQG